MTNTVTFDRIVKTIQTELDNSPWQIHYDEGKILWIVSDNATGYRFSNSNEAEVTCDRLNTEWVARKIIEAMRPAEYELGSVYKTTSMTVFGCWLDAILTES